MTETKTPKQRIKELIRETRWNAKISEDGNKMQIKPYNLMAFFIELEDLIDLLKD